MNTRAQHGRKLFQYEQAILKLIEEQGFISESQVRRLKIQFQMDNNLDNNYKKS